MADYILLLEIFEDDTELGQESGFKEYKYAVPPMPIDSGFSRSKADLKAAREDLICEIKNFANNQSTHNQVYGNGRARKWTIVDADSGKEVEASE